MKRIPPHAQDTPQQKAALLAWWLAHGEGLTVDAVGALLFGRVCDDEIGRMVRSLAQVIPIEYDERSGIWAAVPGELREAFSREQRAAVIAWRFARGEELTVMQVANSLGVQRRTAGNLLTLISGVIPIYDTNVGPNLWLWRVCSDVYDDDEGEEA